MRLTVVGSGDAFHGGGRLHSCYLLEDAGQTVMIDFGATALYGLKTVARTTADIHTYCVTHLHGDHMGGLPFMFIDALYQTPRSSPLRIIGPVGLEARLDAVMAAMYPSIALRQARAPQMIIEELNPGDRTRVAGFELQTFPADHQDPPEQPLCLRFVPSHGRTVAFSGDTRIGDGLLAAAHGVDLLVAECSGLKPPAGRHSTWVEWQATFPRLTTRQILFSHLSTSVRDAIPRLLREAPATPRIAFADDGMVIDLDEMGDTGLE